MEQDWTTVRGKKYDKKCINNNTFSWKEKDAIILININTIVETELAKIKPYNSPFIKNCEDKQNSLKVEYNNI